MDDGTDTTARSVLGLPAWIRTRWPARLAFLLIGARSCSFACLWSVAFFHGGSRAWRDHAVELFALTSVAFAYGLLLVPLLLNRTDVRRSVPFVWCVTFALTWFGLLVEERLGWGPALFVLPPVGALFATLVARRWFSQSPAGGLQDVQR